MKFFLDGFIKKRKVKLLRGMQYIQIISDNSVEGILISAALIRFLNDSRAKYRVTFTKSSEVYQINPNAWCSGQNIIFVNLGVNDQNSDMMIGLISKIRFAGDKVIAVIDNHREGWKKVLGSFRDLLIEPQSLFPSDLVKSSGFVFMDVIRELDPDFHLCELLLDANKAAKGDFVTHFGRLCNFTLRSLPYNKNLPSYLVRCFSQHYEGDSFVHICVENYENILKNHQIIFSEMEKISENIVLIDISGKKVDRPVLISSLFLKTLFPFIVLLGREVERGPIVVVYAADGIDLESILKGALIDTWGGVNPKIMCNLEEKERIIEVLKAWHR